MALHGKRTLVTGAATGIGRATALRVAAEGASVAAFDINDVEGQRTVTAIEEKGGRGRYWRVDVTHAEQVRPGVDEAVEWLGGIDVLLHIAGIMRGAYVPIDQFPEETWDEVIDTNLKGSFLVVREVAHHMMRQGHGVIVLTSSGAGVLGGSASYAYGSSKGGTHGLTMVLDRHLSEHGIRVNDVLPGTIDTPLTRGSIEETYRRTGDRSAYEKALAGLAAPEGVASVMAFLASGDAAYVRGSVRTR